MKKTKRKKEREVEKGGPVDGGTRVEGQSPVG